MRRTSRQCYRTVFAVMATACLLSAVAARSGSAARAAACDGACVESEAEAARGRRLAVFDDVWRTVQERYYDPSLHGLDWRALREELRPRAAGANDAAQLYGVLRRMLVRLRDPHTRVFAPDENFDWRTPRLLTVGLSVREIGGEIVVVSVARGSEAEASGVRAGDAVVSVDGVSARAILARRLAEQGVTAEAQGATPEEESTIAKEEGTPSHAVASKITAASSKITLASSLNIMATANITASSSNIGAAASNITATAAGDIAAGDIAAASPRTAATARALAVARIFDGARDSLAEVIFKTAEERERRVGLRRSLRVREPFLRVRRAGGGRFRIVQFNAFTPETAAQLARAMRGELRGTEGLVLDLRDNGGGEAEAMTDIASLFLPAGTRLGSFTGRDGRVQIEPQTRGALLSAAHTVEIFRGAVVVLTGAWTASAAEIFVAALKERGRASLVGEGTCGCVLGIRRRHALPDGGTLEISEVNFRTARGARLERVGVAPDEIITPTRRDLYAKQDRAMMRAVELLKRQGKD